MSHSNKRYRSTKQLAKTVGTGAVLTLIAAINTAYAQEAAKQEAVVVTGIRKGIEDAISVKKDADNIVEAISAEDIGKLPDNSIAESIARLPGVTAQRVLGRAQTISIRGMSGDFSGTLLNGREQVSTGDNRNVEFDQYPSELLAGVTIYKTPDASLVGQGLSGTVDLKLVNPLSFPGRTIALNGRLEKNSTGKLNPEISDMGNRFTATYIDQFANRTFGVALGYSHLDLRTQQQKFYAWGYRDPVLNLNGAEAKVFSGQSKRDSIFGVLEWKPTKSYTGQLDIYYSKFDEKIVDRGLVTGLDWNTTQSNTTIGPNGFVSGSTYTWPNANSNNKPLVWGELHTYKDDVSSIGLNNKFDLGGGWKAVADISKSTAKRKERILETYAGANAVGDSYTYTVDPNTGVALSRLGLNYADPNIVKLIDSSGWGQDGYVKYLNVKDDLTALKGAITKDIGTFFSNVEAGVSYADRKKTKEVPEALLYLKSSPTSPGSLLLSPINLTAVGYNGSVLAWNIDEAANQYYNLVNKTHPDIYNKQWSVNEKVTYSYLKGNVETELGAVPVHGNVGVQLVHTDQKGTGLVVNKSGTSCVSGPGNSQFCPNTLETDGKTYNDFLPSLNLAFNLPNDFTMRFAAGKQIARARLDKLKNSLSVGYDNGQQAFKGDGGNPKLDPFRARAVDLSFEKYFDKKAYIAVAGFYKDLQTYIYEADTLITGNFADAAGHTSTQAIVKLPQNGTGGKITGHEISVSLPLSLLSPVMNGFGVQGSYSDTHSAIKPFGPTDTRPLPGLSAEVVNLTAYYENYGFQFRISERYRSPYLGEIQGFGADRDYVYIDKERVRDMQIGYEFQSGAMKGLSVLFQVNNLNNAPYRTYVDSPAKPTKEYSTFGRTYLLGVNYKF